MSCPPIQRELVAYHFGAVSRELRQDVESHLLDCSSCLRDYLALKREIETAETGPRPSAAARQRLRAAVARELRRREPSRPWRWWERPLAFGFAGAAVIAAVVATQLLTPEAGAVPNTLAADAASAQR